MAVSLALTCTQDSQSVANNTSTITIKGTVSWTYGSFNLSQQPGTITINGTKYSFSSAFNTGQTTNGSATLFTKQVTIAHESDGTKTVSYSASYDTDVSSGVITASGNKTLTTIPRKTEISALIATMGVAVTINLNRKSSGFTHTLKYEFGSATGTIVTGAGASASWTPPKTLANQIPNATTGTGKLICETYSGGTLVGTSTSTLKLTVSADALPSFTSITVEESVASVKSLGIYVQGKSKLKLTITGAAGSYGSTIKNYTITVDDQVIYASSGTTAEIKSSGSLTVEATITDSRGRSASKTITITVVAYSPPKLTSYSAARQSTATNVLVVASGSITSLKNGTTEKNSLTYVIKYKLTTAASYTSVTVQSSGLSFSNLQKTLTSIDSTKTYDIQLVISDYFTSVTYPLQLPTATVIADLKKAGVGIGKYHEKGVLDVAGAIYSNGTLVSVNGHKHTWSDVTGKPDIFPVGSVQITVTNTNPGTYLAGTWTAFGQGRTLVGVNTSETEFNTVLKTGGEKTHTLSETEMPTHRHTVYNVNNGGNVTVPEGSGYGIDFSQNSPFKTWGAKMAMNTTGGNGAHNNLQPYITVYFWRRTA